MDNSPVAVWLFLPALLLAISGASTAIGRTWSGFSTRVQGWAIGIACFCFVVGIAISLIPTNGPLATGTLYNIVYVWMVDKPPLDRGIDAGFATLCIDFINFAAFFAAVVFYLDHPARQKA